MSVLTLLLFSRLFNKQVQYEEACDRIEDLEKDVANMKDIIEELEKDLEHRNQDYERWDIFF